jgi:leucyl/phenylalanyl-tRNA---protein transferase
MFPSDDFQQTLHPELLIVAYCNGYFPMASSRIGRIEWYSPDPRAIIPLDTFRTPRSLRRTIRRQKFKITFDEKFETVMQCCAGRPATWISEEIVDAYVELFHRGFAHSVEVWNDERLVGGLYGVAIHGAFFGESMFSRMTDASKVALVMLVERLNRRGYTLPDTQFMTEHLRQFGTREIPRSEYLRLLSEALNLPVAFV